MADTINCLYNTLKEIKSLRGLSFSYLDLNERYVLILVDNAANKIFTSEILKSNESDVNDFETNYKSTSTRYGSYEECISVEVGKFHWAQHSSRGSLLVTDIVHRKNLTYQPIGFYFTTNTTANGTYTPLTKSVPITEAASSGQNHIKVSSLRNFAPLFNVTIREGEMSEVKTIHSINHTSKRLILTSALSNSYTTAGTVSLDLVKVSLDGQTSVVDFYVTEENSNVNARGIDIQKAYIYGDFINGDIVDSYVWHPYYGQNIQLVNFVENMCFSSKINYYSIEAPTTSTISPGLVIRIKFKAADTSQRFFCVFMGVWRA